MLRVKRDGVNCNAQLSGGGLVVVALTGAAASVSHGESDRNRRVLRTNVAKERDHSACHFRRH